MPLEPRVAPKGPTVNLTLRVPAALIEEMRNASMFNKFSPFPNVSHFAIDAFLRNLELWQGDKMSPELKAALVLAQVEYQERIENAAAELEGKIITALRKGQWDKARKMIAGLPPASQSQYLEQLP